VNNESSEIIRMLNSEFKGIAGDDFDFYPPALRPEIDRINELVYASVNNGVYRCGFARTQEAYEAAYDALFATLDELEALLGPAALSGRPADDRSRLAAVPDARSFRRCLFLGVQMQQAAHCRLSLLNYMRELYLIPGVAATVKPRYYVINYWSIKKVNPSGIIPKGTPVDFGQAHDRARLAA
jgi:glutathionyl-hydroquinone reductase